MNGEGTKPKEASPNGKTTAAPCSSHGYVGYSVTLKVERSNQFHTFPVGSRLCVAQAWRGRLRLVEYAGGGPNGELKWIDPADVEIWRPAIGQRFLFLPEGESCVIRSIEDRGPGWHRAYFEDVQEEYGVHDQELVDIAT